MRPATIVHPDTGEVTRTTVRMTSPCGKRLYSSRKVALGHASIVGREVGQRLTAVHCLECHGYHVAPKPTHQPRRIPQ